MLYDQEALQHQAMIMQLGATRAGRFGVTVFCDWTGRLLLVLVAGFLQTPLDASNQMLLLPR